MTMITGQLPHYSVLKRRLNRLRLMRLLTFRRPPPLLPLIPVADNASCAERERAYSAWLLLNIVALESKA